VVSVPIDLDDELERWAQEVHDEGFDHLLSFESAPSAPTANG
jgi:hypothetical protein